MNLLKTLLLVSFIALAGSTQAQPNVKAVVKPGWAPANSKSAYYFLPDIQSYYDVRTGHYITMNKGTWVRTKTLPSRYRSYNFNKGNIVPLTYVGNSPHVHYKTHKVKYHKGAKNIEKSHKSNNGLHLGHKNGNGNGNGNGKGHGNKGKKD